MVNDWIRPGQLFIDQGNATCGTEDIASASRASENEFTGRIMVELLLDRVVDAQSIHARDSRSLLADIVT